MFSYKNNQMLTQAREARFQPKLILQILLFFVVYMVGTLVASIIIAVPTMVALFTDHEIISIMISGDIKAAITAVSSVTEKPWIMLLSLFVTAATTAACFIYCRKIEKRSFISMGFRKQGWLARYLKGYVIGTIMLLLCALIVWLMGDLDFAFAKNISVPYILAFFIGYIIQGMSEEVLVRGYFMVSLNNRCHTAVAVGISSVVFALLHLANPGISLLAMVNLTLFGVFMAVYILRTDDLFGACAIHSAWNFTQGNLVGISVSGTAQLPTVAVMNPIGNNALFHGGDFGLEGSLIVTFMLLTVILLTLFLPRKTQQTKSV